MALADIVAQFLNPTADNLPPIKASAKVLAAPTVAAVSGLTFAAGDRTPMKAALDQFAQTDTASLLSDVRGALPANNTADANPVSKSVLTTYSDSETKKILSLTPSAPITSQRIVGSSTVSIGDKTVKSEVRTSTPITMGQAIANQVGERVNVFVRQDQQTQNGKKTITRIFTETPSIPIEQQQLKNTTQQTKDGKKTITKVYAG